MTRSEKVAEAQRLRAQGLKVREVAERMGVARSTAQEWLSDPDLSKQRVRRARYSQPCVDCGGPTDGSGGFAVRRIRCNPCAGRHVHETRYWTQATIIGAIHAFADRYSRPPSATDWNSAQAIALGRPDRAERFYAAAGAWPSLATVQREFGSWMAAIRAAGYESNPAGRPGRAVAA